LSERVATSEAEVKVIGELLAKVVGGFSVGAIIGFFKMYIDVKIVHAYQNSRVELTRG